MTEKIWQCSRFEEKYPKRLLVYENMPQTIYVKGKLPLETGKTVAIVGARVCSHYGAYQAYRFAKELAQQACRLSADWQRGLMQMRTKGLWMQVEILMQCWDAVWIFVIQSKIRDFTRKL